MPLLNHKLTVPFGPAFTGLAGTVGYQFRDGAKAAVGIRVTAGITEPDAGTGVYEVVVASIPDNAISVTWDTGGAPPAQSAVQDLAPLHQAFLLEKAAAFAGFVWVDPVNGSPGTAFPLGTRGDPVSVMADAFTIADGENGLNSFMILGDVTVPSPRADAIFEGIDTDVEFDVDGQNLDGSRISGLSVKGDAAGADLFLFDCVLQAVTNFTGRATRCRLEGTQTISNGEAEFLECFSSQPGAATPVLSMAGPTATFGVRAYAGGIEIAGMSAVGNVGSVDMIAGQIIVAATCSAGVLEPRGVGRRTDNSTGTSIDWDGFLSLPDIQAEIITDDSPFLGADIPAIKARVDLLETESDAATRAAADIAAHLVTQAALTAQNVEIAIIAGLVQQNFILDTTTYNGSGLLTAGRVRIFDSAANVPATGGGSETAGLLATFNITAVAESGDASQVDYYRVVKA